MTALSPEQLPDFDEARFNFMCERIADDLSTQSYCMVDGFISPDEVTALRDIIDDGVKEGEFKPAGIGAAHQFQQRADIRSDLINWIDPNRINGLPADIVRRVRATMAYINRTCYLGLKDIELHYAVYAPGAFYKRHLDQFQVSSHRRLTFILYLNDPGWEISDGGLLRMYLNNTDGQEIPFDVAPIGGRLVVFRSDQIEHEVLLCQKRRYSITGWMLDQLNELTFL